MKVVSIALILLLNAIPVFSQKADYSKLSPSLRRMAIGQARNVSKAKELNEGKGSGKCVVAFVRCGDTDVLGREGCRVLESLDDIHIARIPLSKLSALSLLPEIKRIEAGSPCKVTMDTTGYVVRVDKVHEGRGENGLTNAGGYTGRNVIVGVQDICFDLTHPTFRTTDGKSCRIKALWDQLAEKDSEDSPLPVGRQYLGQEDILALQHTRDCLLGVHGTHTSAIAAGSGWDGRTCSRYRGIAPDADICLVCNYSGDNKDVVDEEDRLLYSDAMDILGFKYIFDYADRQGKPCVINFSEGRYEDFYGETMYYEAVEKLLGPGRIICASAGNDGRSRTYLRKNKGEDHLSTFIHSWWGEETMFLRADARFRLSLDFIYYNGDRVTMTYDFDDVLNAEDSIVVDTIEVKGTRFQVLYCVYPSGLDADEWGAEFYLTRLGEGSIGAEPHVLLTLNGKETEIDVYSVRGELKANKTLCADSKTAETGHLILFPGASKNVICVGSTTYTRTLLNHEGKAISFRTDVEGEKSDFSSMGPTIQGFIKPDVVAPGENIVSANSSFYLEKFPESHADVDVERFVYEGRTYAWTALTGTSMSTPVVTGVIALWLDACPTLTPEQVLQVIQNTSQRKPGMDYPNNDYGWGEIDAKAGLDYVLSEYCGITDVALREDVRSGKVKYYYDINGRRIRSVEGLRGIFFAVDERGVVRKVVRNFSQP